MRYRHTLDAFLRIYRGEGIHAFYRGLIPSLVGVSHVAVQFPLYEELKLSMGEPITPVCCITPTHYPAVIWLKFASRAAKYPTYRTFPRRNIHLFFYLQDDRLARHIPTRSNTDSSTNRLLWVAYGRVNRVITFTIIQQNSHNADESFSSTEPEGNCTHISRRLPGKRLERNVSWPIHQLNKNST